MSKKDRQLRYIEISRRNQVSRLYVGTCAEVCIDIQRTGSDCCEPKIEYNACCQAEYKPLCDTNVAYVCALEVDDDGFAVFEWPDEMLNLTQGWYTGYVMNGCECCGEIPVRIGPRCNVIEVETVVNGPDSLCYVGCEDECQDEVCPTNKKVNKGAVYTPSYKR